MRRRIYSPYVVAVTSKAGLELEAEKAPVDVLVIDRADKAPKAN